MNKTTDKYLEKTNIATWNVQGKLCEDLYQHRLVEDMVKRKVQIACLQETHWKEEETKNT